MNKTYFIYNLQKRIVIKIEKLKICFSGSHFFGFLKQYVTSIFVIFVTRNKTDYCFFSTVMVFSNRLYFFVHKETESLKRKFVTIMVNNEAILKYEFFYPDYISHSDKRNTNLFTVLGQLKQSVKKYLSHSYLFPS